MREKSIPTEKVINMLIVLVAQSGYNYKQLSERSGVSQNTLTTWFSSTPPQKIKPSNLRKICSALEIEEDSFTKKDFNIKAFVENKRYLKKYFKKNDVLNGKKWKKTNGGKIIPGCDNLLEELRNDKRNHAFNVECEEYLKYLKESYHSSNAEKIFSELKQDESPIHRHDSSKEHFEKFKKIIIEDWKKQEQDL